jgi:hypothetical protein
MPSGRVCSARPLGGPDQRGEIRLKSAARRLLVLAIGVVVQLLFSTGAPAVVLHDQTDNVGADAITSEAFSTPQSIDDTQVADDFSVPVGQSWAIVQIDLIGLDHPYLGTSPPSGVNLFIYRDAGTSPGSQVFRLYGIGTTGYPNQSAIISGAPKPPPLGPGTYWISVQEDGGQFMAPSWAWFTRTVQSGHPAAFEAPGGGWGSNCTSWQPITVCPSSISEPDMAWKISGSAASLHVTFGKLKRFANGTARLAVNVPGPGSLALRGSGVKGRSPQVSAGPADTTLTFRIKATGKPLKTLTATGRATVKPIFYFTSGAAAVSKTFRKVRLVKH